MSFEDCQKSGFFLLFLQTEADAKDIFPYGNQTNGTVIAFFFFVQICNAYITMGCQVTVVYEARKSLLQLITVCSSTNEVILYFCFKFKNRISSL